MIRWEKRISECDKYIDLRGVEKTALTWEKGTGHTETIYDVEIKMPDMPPVEDMVNFGLDEHDQIFRKVLIPIQVRNPTKNFGRENWTEAKKEEFINLMWHIRKNGYWILIKNRPTYIPGLLFFKMNFCDPKNIFIYKTSDRHFFTYWLASLYAPCDGVIDYKCRQLGDTENFIVIEYEYASRVRNRNVLMQAAPKEDRAEEAFFRFTHIHRKMIYFFKPIAMSEDPRGGEFEFNYPQEAVTAKRIKEKDKQGEMVSKNIEDMYEYPPLNTKLMMGPSFHGHFDGTTDVGRAFLDEFGKAKKGFSPREWINVIKEAIFNKNIGKKTGHMGLASTVEDLYAELMDEVISLWESSDPNSPDKMPDGKTVSGLWRMFRGVADRGEEGMTVDRWGDIDREEIIKLVTEKFEKIFKVAGAKAAYSYLRKNPRTIEDVFMSVANLTQFNTTILTNRKIQLMNKHPKPWVRGNLKWRDGMPDTEVVWEPNENGKWVISHHPDRFGLKANAKVPFVTMASPGNVKHFSAGCDPIDQKITNATESERSKLGLTIHKNFDADIDREDYLYHQDNHPDGLYSMGDPVDYGMNHITNKPCCIYLDRNDDINVNFEDVILTLVYYGVDVLAEKQKFGGLRTYMEGRGYVNYVPNYITSTRNWRGQVESEAITAGEKTFQESFSAADSYISKWGYAIDILDLIDELSTMNYANKGKKDLGVSFLWAIYHSFQKRIYFGDSLKEEQVVPDEGFWEPEAIN